jgi:tRNA (guanine6-N2)-methyltransferase
MPSVRIVMTGTRSTYLVQTLPGFEVIAAQEIERKMPEAKVLGRRRLKGKNGMVLFETSQAVEPGDLFRTAEDLFVLVASGMGTRTPHFLGTLRSRSRQMSLEPALRAARRLAPDRAGQRKHRFRVVARHEEDSRHFRRLDAQLAVEEGILSRSDHRWERAENAPYELWLTLLRNEWLLALRLTDERLRHRKEKREHLPASLRPSAAAALVWLTQPRPDDVFVDPMCGAGTLLIERALTERYQMLWGGDIRDEAVSVAQANIGSKYKPIELARWDARALPLQDASATAMAVNLPFGKQIGTAQGNRQLYPAFLEEAARVLRGSGRLVTLTSDLPPLERALELRTHFEIQARYPVEVLGQPAQIFVLQRIP